MLLERIIYSRGHEVVGCRTAEDAVEEMMKGYYPLITLDIQLPGMSGLEFCKLLRSTPEGQYLYILVATSNSRPEDLREILDAGADDYIAKPYNPGLLDVRLTIAETAVKAIAKRKALEDELKFLAQHDPLTRLNNRTALDPALERAIALARKGRQGAVLYLDLDNFKIINDTLGHEAGDKLLLQVTDVLKSLARPGDVLVRFGGDEFVFILPNCGHETAVGIAESIVSGVESIIFTGQDRTFRVGASVGVAEINGKIGASEVMANADEACYAAKARGRNRVEIYHEGTSEIAQLITDTDWSTRVRDAMRDGSLQLYFQPVVSVLDRKILFHEVLLRYIDPRYSEAVNPQVFLSAIRRVGQTTKLDRFVITKAFEALAINPALSVSINISGSLFGDQTYTDFVEGMLKVSEINPRRVLFEITENELIPNLQNASGAITHLQQLGCRFGLDDFGSGFSTLTYLKSLPIDFLKIEGAFTRDLPNQPFNQAVLRALQVIADTIKVETIAEFVETEGEMALLKEIGIVLAQGHYIAKARETPYTESELFQSEAPAASRGSGE